MMDTLIIPNLGMKRRFIPKEKIAVPIMVIDTNLS
jgi:hypothetical protein